MSDEEASAVEDVKTRHKKEKKDLQAKIANLKKTAKCGGKKQQKEATEEAARLEKGMEERHRREEKEVLELGSSATSAPVIVKNRADEKSFYKDDGVKIKNQKKHEKKAEEAKRRAEAAAADAEATKTSFRTSEMEAVSRALSSRGLRLVDIPPDGDCLFNALADQLAHADVNGQQLRKRAAGYIKDNGDMFLPFLTREDGEMLDEMEFEEYCIKIEKKASDGGHWGGEPELRALSESLQRRIEVVQPDTCVLLFGESYGGRPLVITYHRHAYDLGEHYNSTVAVTAPLK